MARHLNEHDIERIVELLDGWKGKLTWKLLCDACERTINIRPTRQTLAKFQRIVGAYKAVKESGREEVEALSIPPVLSIAAQRIERLTRENERLKRENTELLEQFVVWQYNAHAKGLTEHDLNQVLPGIDRGQTGLV